MPTAPIVEAHVFENEGVYQFVVECPFKCDDIVHFHGAGKKREGISSLLGPRSAHCGAGVSRTYVLAGWKGDRIYTRRQLQQLVGRIDRARSKIWRGKAALVQAQQHVEGLEATLEQLREGGTVPYPWEAWVGPRRR